MFDELVSAIYRHEYDNVARLATKELLTKADKGGYTPLHIATTAGIFDRNVLEILLKAGAEVNAPERKAGWTSLHFAAYHHNREAVELLLEFGASVNVRDSAMCTPLLRCLEGFAIGDDDTVIRELIDAGADPYAENLRDESPLSIAEERELSDVIALMT